MDTPWWIAFTFLGLKGGKATILNLFISKTFFQKTRIL